MSDNQQYGKWEVVEGEIGGFIKFVKDLEQEDSQLYVMKTSNTSGNFLREVKAASEMDHPNIFNVVDYSLDGDNPYLVAEYLKGGSLHDANYLEWTYHDRMVCFNQLCSAYAHIIEQGWSRFDRNLHNTMLKEDGRTPVLIDFERATKMDRESAITQFGRNAAGLYWKLFTGEEIDSTMHKEKLINKQIEEFTSKIEELKQQKSKFLN